MISGGSSQPSYGDDSCRPAGKSCRLSPAGTILRGVLSVFSISSSTRMAEKRRKKCGYLRSASRFASTFRGAVTPTEMTSLARNSFAD